MVMNDLQRLNVPVVVSDDSTHLFRQLLRILAQLDGDYVVLLHFALEAQLADFLKGLVHDEVVSKSPDDHRCSSPFSAKSDTGFSETFCETVGHSFPPSCRLVKWPCPRFAWRLASFRELAPVLFPQLFVGPCFLRTIFPPGWLHTFAGKA